MANYTKLIESVAAVIKQNGRHEITGSLLQQTLVAIINSVGNGALFAGVATPTSDPGIPDQNVFYIASEAGTYDNFGKVVLDGLEVSVLYNTTQGWKSRKTGISSLRYVEDTNIKIDNSVIEVNKLIALGNDLVQEEAVRVSNERDRKSNEQTRISNELLREKSEAKRELNEDSRDREEITREKNEVNRDAREIIREKNEVSREALKGEMATLKDEVTILKGQTETVKTEASQAATDANQAADRANGNLIEDVSSTIISLAVVENTTYKYGTLASLTITSIPNSNLPSFIYFTSGTTATTFAYPSGMKIRGYSVPVANARYVISIFNGVVTIVKV